MAREVEFSMVIQLMFYLVYDILVQDYDFNLVVLTFKTDIIVLFCLGCKMIKLFRFRCLIVVIKFNYACLLVCLLVAQVKALQLL